MYNNMQSPEAGAQERPKEDAPWWLKYGGRGLGTVAGLFAFGLGAFNCVTITPWCLVAGIWQMLAAFLTLVVEAPCLCMFLEFVQNLNKRIESKPYWARTAFYAGISIPAVLMCQSLSIIFGSGLIFATGVLYGVMALGKKGSRDEMMAAASAQSNQSAVLVEDPDVWRAT